MAGFDSDVDVQIEAEFGGDPFSNSLTYPDDISQHVRAAEWGRGRSSLQSQFSAGTGSLTLDNSDGRFYPWNTSGAYSPDVTVGTPVRITATYDTNDYEQTFGFVTDWTAPFPTNSEELTRVPFTETIERLNRFGLTEPYAADTTDGRIDDVLDDAGWPTGRRNLDAGVAPVAAIAADGSALSIIRSAEIAEQGRVFQDRSGDVRFLNRVAFSSPGSPTHTFGPGASELTYVEVTTEHNHDTLANRASVTGATGGQQTAEDTTSRTTHGPVSYPSINDDSVVSAAHALNVAEWIVAKYATVQTRVAGFTVDPAGDPSNLWVPALTLDVGSIVNVQAAYPGSPVELNQDVVIEQLRHRFDMVSGTWLVSYLCHPLSDLEQEVFWTLGTSLLDTETILA